MREISLLLLVASCAATHQEDKELPLKRNLRQCYLESDSYTGMKGKVQGKILMDVMVTPEGKVLKADIIKTDFKDPNLNACVKGVFKMNRIENKSGNTINMMYPVTFEAVRR